MEETPVMMLENRFFEYGVLNGYIYGDPTLIVADELRVDSVARKRYQIENLKRELEASFATMPEEVENQRRTATLSAERAKLDEVVKTENEAVKAAVAAMPVYWDAAKIGAESSFMSGLSVQYDGELQGAKVGAAIHVYREHEARLEHI